MDAPRLRRIAVRTAMILAVLVVLVYAVVVRPWHMHWGATLEERTRELPGDRYIATSATVSTRALTIAAPSAVVWSWLVQLGQGRGGFYSYEWLENLFAAGMRNADRLDPRLQDLHVGDTVSFQQDGPSTIVTAIDPGRMLVLGDGWSFVLDPVDVDRTRLVVRYPYARRGDLLDAAYYYALFEPAHFVMESGMMLGIKERSERAGARLLDRRRKVDQFAAR
jgi:hypothetical protein